MRCLILKKLFSLLLLITLSMALIGCSRSPEEVIFNGVVVDVSGNNVIIFPVDNEYLPNQRIIVSGIEVSADVSIGSTLAITFNGEITETYPAQIEATSWDVVGYLDYHAFLILLQANGFEFEKPVNYYIGESGSTGYKFIYVGEERLTVRRPNDDNSKIFVQITWVPEYTWSDDISAFRVIYSGEDITIINFLNKVFRI